MTFVIWTDAEKTLLRRLVGRLSLETIHGSGLFPGKRFCDLFYKAYYYKRFDELEDPPEKWSVIDDKILSLLDAHLPAKHQIRGIALPPHKQKRNGTHG